jgi:hypothetical protein
MPWYSLLPQRSNFGNLIGKLDKLRMEFAKYAGGRYQVAEVGDITADLADFSVMRARPRLQSHPDQWR